MSKQQKKFVIIDGNAIIHRAWHALPPTMSTKDGTITNAAYGFTSILLRTIKDLKPDYLAVTFDMPGKTFRHEEYKEYKATRKKKEQELYDQIPIIKDIVSAFQIPIYEKAGFEADDLIGTIVRGMRNEELGIRNIIVTGDNDILQLVDQNTEVYSMRKGISDMVTYGTDEVIEKYDGLTPGQLIDYKGIRGDPSDNLPGVCGIGEKGATQILNEFKTLENVYKNIDSPKISDRNRKLLKEHKKEALLSKKLATIKTNVKIKFNLDENKLEAPDLNTIVPLFQKLEFKSLMHRLPNAGNSSLVTRHSSQNTEDSKQASLFSSAKDDNPRRPFAVEEGSVNYQLINSEKKFEDFFAKLKKQKSFAFDIETTGFRPMEDKLLGIGIAWKVKEAFYVPAKKEWLKKLKSIFENEAVKKIAQNIKFDIEGLITSDIIVKGELWDTMIASYLTNPGTRRNGLDAQAFAEFGYQMQPITDLIGKKGKNQITLQDVELQRVSDYCCEDVDFTLRLVPILEKRLQKTSTLKLFKEIEMPLVHVLIELEKNGVLIDTPFLKKMSGELSKRIVILEKKIYKLAGIHFNVASPAQLKEILFEKLKISTEGISKTKTGISSAASELEKMKDDHPIIPLIVEYRELTKLTSTYIDALPRLVSRRTGRLHTSYNQTIAATGRLSSTHPNLQNIPIRTELGQKIRRAFVSKKGFKLMAADYSQIELRIVASLSNDKAMINGFKNNEDIHARTAAEMNNVKLEEVTKAMRRAAKTINFGVLYGMGPHGLAQTEGITFKEARAFIDTYFTLHKNIKKYLDDTKDFARDKGYVETLFERRRYLPEIHSGVQQIRSGAERMAINHPVQGTAADLLKLAMIEIHKTLPKISEKTKMLLQVHDELVFEVPNDDVKKVKKLVKEKMENIHKLKCPITVDIEVGDNWEQMEKL